MAPSPVVAGAGRRCCADGTEFEVRPRSLSRFGPRGCPNRLPDGDSRDGHLHGERLAVTKDLHRRKEVAEHGRLEGVDGDDGLGVEGGHKFADSEFILDQIRWVVG